MREKQASANATRNKNGITPACAGKTRGEAGKSKAERDHPRVCGKNKYGAKRSIRCTGSPPRVREKLDILGYRSFERGITPACAGKTFHDTNEVPLIQDHPRVCGKNGVPAIRRTVFTGSPPRVREKLLHLKNFSIDYRITPACAGKTLPTSHEL